MNLTNLLISILFLSSSTSFAKETSLWLRQMPPTVKMGAAFGDICNNSDKEITLSYISSSYGKVEFHAMYMQNGIMKMKEIEMPKIASKKCFHMEPGANHIMILNIKKQASAGDKIHFLLKFSNGEQKTLDRIGFMLKKGKPLRN